MIYEIRCAWCGIKTGYKDMSTSSPVYIIDENIRYEITHGICDNCRKEVLNEIRSTPIKTDTGNQ